MRTAAPILPIFRSSGQSAVLAEVFLSPAELSAAEVAQRCGLSYPTVRREARELIEAGLLAQRQVGQSQLLSPDQSSPYFGPLREILNLAFGVVPRLRDALQPIGGIEAAAVFGSYAERMVGGRGPAPVDIDVVVVGDPDVNQVYAACTEVSRHVGREVNPVIVSAAEWLSPEPFLAQVRGGALLDILGDVAAIGAPAMGESAAG
ncbi:MAG: winged helix-turn-helix domain-containing protein [Actinomycetota bacterium]|nr:winged helix-turn-helix domain-containing protein [Actinomycetota bacterium]